MSKRRFIYKIISYVLSILLVGMLYSHIKAFKGYDRIAWVLIAFSVSSLLILAHRSEKEKMLKSLPLLGVSLSALGTYLLLFSITIEPSRLRSQMAEASFDKVLFDKGVWIFVIGFLISFISSCKNK
ncbi:MAG: hypothetical protein JW869_06275 [Candidatus Omnitrophica bacterium]|nr:hypothetical protein [Candidatus Omnitrophota bacterium]